MVSTDVSNSGRDLSDFEQRLGQLVNKLAAFRELEAIEAATPDEWASMQEQILALESRMQEYLDGLTDMPALFWQVVRWGGLGLLLGILLQRWILGC